MGDADKFYRKRTKRDFSAQWYRRDPQPVLQSRLFELVLHQFYGEGRRVNRATQFRPEMCHRADMILMSVRQYDAEQILPDIFQETDVRHHQVHTWRRCLPPKQHAAIDDDPGPLIRWPITVAIQIHTDFARSPQREKHEFRTTVARFALHYCW